MLKGYTRRGGKLRKRKIENRLGKDNLQVWELKGLEKLGYVAQETRTIQHQKHLYLHILLGTSEAEIELLNLMLSETGCCGDDSEAPAYFHLR